jgi:hypothetical protein
MVTGSNFVGIKIIPVLTGKETLFKIDRKSEKASPILFYTATSSMRLLRRGKEIFMEHLKLDGNIEMLPYKGQFLGDLNFINIGWDYGTYIEYLIVDPYSGESKVGKRDK